MKAACFYDYQGSLFLRPSRQLASTSKQPASRTIKGSLLLRLSRQSLASKASRILLSVCWSVVSQLSYLTSTASQVDVVKDSNEQRHWNALVRGFVNWICTVCGYTTASQYRGPVKGSSEQRHWNALVRGFASWISFRLRIRAAL